ncbi:TetR/AcrR family transcriptional regulator [Nonomuraea lactucae]|uniref:TetR/AcrR family transcriptional regulator n=1 Tax=Nonomuraea lactucae TaxID=2249762 RepID=UPI001F05BF70|nr:TetR/AcrR family transcriptional regulator [Nonomuraea lactucae]
MISAEQAELQVLDAAETLFYTRGIQVVGMDDIRSASGVSLKRLYQIYPSKEELVQAYLRRRDLRWRRRLAAHVETRATPQERILAVFDWLHAWFSEPGFRGCAFINSFGELGATSPAVVEAARAHKEAFFAYLATLTADAGRPAWVADHLALLAEGAMTTAAITGTPAPAHQARQAAHLLLEATETV